jgi:hypothetical protein
MNRLFNFGFLALLVLFISNASAECIVSPNCDCEPANIAGCSGDSPLTQPDLACGFELNCNDNLSDHIYQRNGKGGFCHFAPCTNGCVAKFPDSDCK